MAYISQVKIGSTTYDVKAKALADEVIADLKKSAMTYKGPITQTELDKLTPTFTDKENGYVYTITDKENKEVVWYKGPNDTTGRLVDIGRDDAHAHAVSINGTEKTFDSNGKVNFRLTFDVPYNTGSAYNKVTKAGGITDPQHTHALSGAPTLSTTTSEVAVSAPATGETPTYKPSGTISAVSFTDYATGINGASYTPKGSLTGGSASIPAGKVVTNVSVSSDAISHVKIYPNQNFDDLGLVDDVTPKESDVSVSGTIPASQYYVSLDKNAAKDISLSGTSAIIASVSGEVLTLTPSLTPAGKITIPANSFVTGGSKNLSVAISSTGKFTPSITVRKSKPYKGGWNGANNNTLFSIVPILATTTATVTKNEEAISCSFTAPTFSGTPATITPTLKTGSKSVTPTFTGTGVMLKYTKATGATAGTLAVGKSSTGITHTDPVLGTGTFMTDIPYNDMEIDVE